jgi:hypothetical protein
MLSALSELLAYFEQFFFVVKAYLIELIAFEYCFWLHALMIAVCGGMRIVDGFAGHYFSFIIKHDQCAWTSQGMSFKMCFYDEDVLFLWSQV